MHGLHAFSFSDDQFIECVDIRLCAGDDDIHIRAVTAIDARIFEFTLRVHFCVTAAIALNADSHFAERVNACGDGVNIELEKFARRFGAEVAAGFGNTLGKLSVR